jgi:hypothetical protein
MPGVREFPDVARGSTRCDLLSPRTEQARVEGDNHFTYGRGTAVNPMLIDQC